MTGANLIPPANDPTRPAITPPEPKFWTGRVEVTWSGYDEVEIRECDECYSEADARECAMRLRDNDRVMVRAEVLEITSGP